MKHLKTYINKVNSSDLQSLYENTIKFNDINPGDFVQIKTKDTFYGFIDPDKIRNIVNTSIGKIIDKKNYRGIVVKYDNLISKLVFDISSIVEIGKTKEEVETKLNANKYNL